MMTKTSLALGIVLVGLCGQARAQFTGITPSQPLPTGYPVMPSQPAPSQKPPSEAILSQKIFGQGTPTKSLVSSASIALDYRVDRVGPSGIGKVDIWVTPDQGITWRKLAEETPRKSPLQISLPGEGLFGVRLVAVNGNGFGGNTPKRGDDANFWVEVDMTPPLVQMGNIDAYTDGANLTICWTAQDRNFGPTPIALYYRCEGDQSWQVIARNLKNTGQHRWQFPRDKGDRFYLRVEATDDAGNAFHADTPTAVMLDMVEPQLIVVGVTVNANAQGRTFMPSSPPQTQTTAPPAANVPQDPLHAVPPAPGSPY